MKKINSHKLQAALFRGAVAVSGSMCTITAALFLDNIYGVAFTLSLGAAIIALIDDALAITNKQNKEK